MSWLLRKGRLGATRKDVTLFISSVKSDKRIARATVLANEAHVVALARARQLTKPHAHKLTSSLHAIEENLPIRPDAEDVHLLIEEAVTKKAGKRVGGMLHIGKSRNDQVATAIRIALRENILDLQTDLIQLEESILRFAKKHTNTIFPGYTHLQPAQLITLAHYFLAITDAASRDNERLNEAYKRINRSPLGAGALAGTSIGTSRELEMRLLGFDGLCENSLDAVGSRDFALETLGTLAVLASNISRLIQDLIYYSSADVGLLDLPDEFTSTSSIMPQKKNPDPLEVARARCAIVTSNFSSAAGILHALPSGYNLDVQEITPLLWDSIDKMSACLKILTALIPKLRVTESLTDRQSLAYTAATEIANILVKEEHIPFREAHRIVGQAVRRAVRNKVTLVGMRVEDWNRYLGTTLNERTVNRIVQATAPRAQVTSYTSVGGANPREARRMLTERSRQVRSIHRQNARTRMNLLKSLVRLHSALKAL